MMAKRLALNLLVILVSLRYQGLVALAQQEEFTFRIEVWQSTKELSVRKGENATFVLSIMPMSDLARGREVNVNVQGGPPGASIELSLERCVPPCDVNVKVSTTSKTPEGEFSIVVTAFRGSFKYEGVMRLIVKPSLLPPPTTTAPTLEPTYLPWTTTLVFLLVAIIAAPALIFTNRARIRQTYRNSVPVLRRGVEAAKTIAFAWGSRVDSWLERLAEIE